MGNALHVLLASSEVHPYSKTGGLADMVSAVAKSLAGAGLRIHLVTPFYRGIKHRLPASAELIGSVRLALGKRRLSARIRRLKAGPHFMVYFVDQKGFFDREGLYQKSKADYRDNAERFIFFSKTVAYLARHLPASPRVVHLHDWQTGLVPLLLRHQARRGSESPFPKTCLTIHNLAYQGIFPKKAFGLTNLPSTYFQIEGVEYYGRMNCLKAGILYADRITTVSPRYAREITTAEFGCGLQGVLHRRRKDLIGILNGVDYSEWNTVENPNLRFPYHANDLAGKQLEKAALQKDLGLPAGEAIPLFGTISRLVEQKGIDIELGALEEMLSNDMQFVLLGSGETRFEQGLRRLARRYPKKVAVRIGYDSALAHRIEAACDFYLMPSRFEPCGLNQLYSLRYGTIPIVRAVGGLDDSVIDPREDAEAATGIKFHLYSAPALAKAIRKALVLYQHPDVRRHFQQNGMNADFSRERTAEEYLKIYEELAAS